MAIILHKDPEAGLDQILESTKKILGTEVLDAYTDIIRARVYKGSLGVIVSWDSVRTIEELPSVSLQSNVARQIMGIEDIQKQDQDATGQFYGDGEVIAIIESGLDTGKKIDVLEAFMGRVVDIVGYNKPEPCEDVEGHGTHVAACALGASINYQPNGIYQGSHSGLLPDNIQGVASKAKVFAIAFDYSEKVPNLLDLFSTKYSDGNQEKIAAKISNNSWVSTSGRDIIKFQQPYGEALGKLVDQAMWKDQQLLICFAAGNNGKIETNTGAQIGGVSAAKNCITVGATLNERMMVDDDTSLTQAEYEKQRFEKMPRVTAPYMGKRNNVASFSNRGPTLERRLKPDVVAPDGVILAARSRAKKGVDTNGATDSQTLFFASGTSMSTPFVSGCGAILREALIKKKSHAPSGSLLKALLIHGAVDIKGGNVLINGQSTLIKAAPNSIQGFGLVNLEASLKPILETNKCFVEETIYWYDEQKKKILHTECLTNDKESSEIVEMRGRRIRLTS